MAAKYNMQLSIIMKKREILELTVDKLNFGGEGISFFEDKKVVYKNGIPGQKVRILIKKINLSQSRKSLIRSSFYYYNLPLNLGSSL